MSKKYRLCPMLSLVPTAITLVDLKSRSDISGSRIAPLVKTETISLTHHQLAAENRSIE